MHYITFKLTKPPFMVSSNMVLKSQIQWKKLFERDNDTGHRPVSLLLSHLHILSRAVLLFAVCKGGLDNIDPIGNTAVLEQVDAVFTDGLYSHQLAAKGVYRDRFHLSGK